MLGRGFEVWAPNVVAFPEFKLNLICSSENLITKFDCLVEQISPRIVAATLPNDWETAKSQCFLFFR